MDYREKSEIRDGMRIDWDMPISDGRRRRAPLRHLPADRRGQVSGHHDLRPLRQVAALRRSLYRAVAADVRDPSRRADRLDQQVPMLGGGRSGEMGAGRLCRGPRRQPRRRPLAGRDRHLVAARGAGPRAMRRMGRRAAVVERQGRPQRHFLLRREPVAGRGAATQAPRRDLHSGRAPPISTATWRTTAASSATASRRTGRRRRSTRCSTAAARAASGAA